MPAIKETLYILVSYVSSLLLYPLLRCVAALLLVWLIIKFLPMVLEKAGLRTAVNDTTLRWLNTALIGFTLIFAIIQPFIAFLAKHFLL